MNTSNQKPSVIKYLDLINETVDLFPIIEEAYGKDGLGILVVEDIPDFEQIRTKTLTSINKLAKLSEDELKKYETSFLGWSRGKEIFDNEPDKLKGSFYSVLPKDNNQSSNAKDENIWPDDILPELKPNLIETGSKMRKLGLKILTVIDRYINSKFKSHKLDFTRNQIEQSESCISRGLYYFPKKGLNIKKSDDKYLWSGWHNDHGSLTALCSSLYFDEEGHQGKMNLTKTGLYIKNRKGEDIRATYKANSIAFQIGETLQVQSGGILHATPHAVVVADDIDDNFGRSNFVLFMQPNMNEKIDIPEEAKFEDVKTSEKYNVPKIQDRYKRGMTFHEFHDATMNYFSKEK